MATILVIDDEPNFITLMETLLGRRGHEVLASMNGIEGIAIAEAHQPDLILLDVLMPMIGGVKILRHLGTSEKAAHIPIIVVTAAGGDTLNEIEDMGELAPDHVLAKPFLPDDLLATIDAVLDRDD
jgi:CheY-like chemotaxis protein